MTTEIKTPNGRTVGLSPKALAATAGGAALGVLLAVLNGVQQEPALLGSLPPYLQGIILAVLPPLVLAVVTYRAQLGEIGIPEADLPVIVEATPVESDGGSHRFDG